jgi:hypothetical protein
MSAFMALIILISKLKKYGSRLMNKEVEDYVKDIPNDAILIEVRGGMVSDVHNDSNGYILFDWDSIGEQDTMEFHKKVLKRLLER